MVALGLKLLKLLAQHGAAPVAWHRGTTWHEPVGSRPGHHETWHPDGARHRVFFLLLYNSYYV